MQDEGGWSLYHLVTSTKYWRIVRPNLFHRREITIAKRSVKCLVREDQRIMIGHGKTVVYVADSFKLRPPFRKADRVKR